jgi:hypothetical protein
MDNLLRFTLSKDECADDWMLTNDQTGRVVWRFDTKAMRLQETRLSLRSEALAGRVVSRK